MRRLASLVIAACVLAACGSDGEETVGSAAPPVEATAGVSEPHATDGPDASAPEPAPNSFDADAVYRHLSISVSPTLDPDKAGSPAFNMQLFPLYDRLVFFNSDAEIDPMLAESWELSADPPYLDLVLRDDIVFHSGAPIDAAAVKANLDRSRALEDSVNRSQLAIVSDVEVAGDHTVRIHLSEPNTTILGMLADRAGMIVDPAAFGSDDLSLTGAGSGPYQVAEFRPGEHVRYVRAENYWDLDAQRVAGMEHTLIADDETRLTAVLAGEADGAEITATQVDRAAASAQVVERPILSYLNLIFNNSRGPLQDHRVRKAIGRAIDREGIVQAVYAGKCAATVQTAPAGHFTYSEAVDADEHGYDVEVARALLEEAGHGDGFEITVVIPTIPLYVAALEIVQANLAEIGVDVVIQAVPPTEVASLMFDRKDPDATLTLTTTSASPAIDAALHYLPEAFRNPGGNSTDELISLVEDVTTLVDQDAVEAAWDDLQVEAIDFATTIPICHVVRLIAHGDHVSGLEVYLGGHWEFRGVGISAD
jgi:ABC-type transport system substrate-binding protein